MFFRVGFSAFWLLWLLRGFCGFRGFSFHSSSLFASSALPVPLAFWLFGFLAFWLFGFLAFGGFLALAFRILMLSRLASCILSIANLNHHFFDHHATATF